MKKCWLLLFISIQTTNSALLIKYAFDGHKWWLPKQVLIFNSIYLGCSRQSLIYLFLNWPKIGCKMSTAKIYFFPLQHVDVNDTFRDCPLRSVECHVFHLERRGRRCWINVSNDVTTEVAFYFDSYNLEYKIVAVQGIKVARVNSKDTIKELGSMQTVSPCKRFKAIIYNYFLRNI